MLNKYLLIGLIGLYSAGAVHAATFSGSGTDSTLDSACTIAYNALNTDIDAASISCQAEDEAYQLIPVLGTQDTTTVDNTTSFTCTISSDAQCSPIIK